MALFNDRLTAFDEINLLLKDYFKYNKKKYICIESGGDISLQKIISRYKKLDSKGKFSDIIELKLKNIDKLISIKQLPINVEEKENMFNINYNIWRELYNYKKTSTLVKKKICPNLQLYYGYFICNTCKFKNKRIKDSMCLLIVKEYSDKTFKEWIIEYIKSDKYKKLKSNVKVLFWKNIYFQILIALYSIQKYYYIIHGDLHWDNILINEIKSDGHWLYNINNTKYYIPNLGFQLYITDFGKSINFSKFNIIVKNNENYNDLSKSFSNTDEAGLVCGIDYNIMNIYKWIETDYSMNIDNIIPKTILDMLKDIKFKYINKFPNKLIKMYMLNFLNECIGKSNTNGIKKCTNINDITVGNIVIYNDKYSSISDIDGFNIKVIIKLDPVKEITVNYKKLHIVTDKISCKYNIIDTFNV